MIFVTIYAVGIWVVAWRWRRRWQGFAATASQHFYGQTLKWKQADGDNPPSSQDQDYLEKNGPFQPVIYIARKTHATYFRSGAFKTHLGTSNAGSQYETPSLLSPTDINEQGGPIYNPMSNQLISLYNPAIYNYWKGLWGKKGTPNPLVPQPFLNGPPSPFFRGPGEKMSSDIIIQIDPEDFHNAYIKPTQSQITIP